MVSRRLSFIPVLLVFVFVVLSFPTPAQQAAPVSPSLFSEMRWRSIGPHRASRTRSAAGHRAQPFTFYAGVVNGGVWKTTDAGRTWIPIFDDQPTQSVGAVVVAPSDPNVLYVGSGEGLQRPDLSVGDGVYKSTDAGRTWTNMGLREAQQIANIAVDPRNADRLFVAALGHPYGPNRERGVFRSTNGGRTFEPVLQRDENIGANDVDIDPSDPNVVYATLWEGRQGPWENAAWGGLGDTLFKSTDGGTTWRALKNGLPAATGQINLAIAPSQPQRLYATVATAGVGIYRSDNGGESWTQITQDTRPAGRIGGGDLPVPIVHPKNPDIVIMASTVSWKSTDGGRTWAAFKGAPGGEDYQGGWINPDNPDIILLAADQGAVVSLNGGETWSSWYNQPTAQLYHVAADNAFPYRVCSGQQESGSACVSSRGNYGAISNRDWLPVGVDEYGYVAPDPLNPDLVYGGRSVTRFDRRTGQVSTVGPVGGRGGGAAAPGTAGLTFRQVRTQPVVFSEADKRTLYFANNYLWKTLDGGLTWARISDDPTRKSYDLPKSIGKYADPSQVQQRGVIYTIGPSPRDINRIWIGTDDGVIKTTVNGGTTWADVTPPQIGPWWKVFMIDAGRFDTLTAYAAVNTLRLDDMRPHLYRTHDGGKTWTEIVNGLDGAGPANAIREDPKKRGLLYASTEKSVYVSFDDGDHWQSLRLNLPASSVRDIIVKDDDLVAATHGRGFWILDDVTPLRQITAQSAAADAILFKPTTAWRVRWNTSTDMPWPKEEPTGENPPDGAIINYYLKAQATGPVVLEILQQDGRLVRRYSSTDPVTPVPDAAASPVPLYWYRTPQALSAAPGMHRFIWDVHYQPLAGGGGGGRGGGLPISSVPGRAAPAPTTPWVNPGTYTVKLTVNGQSLTQPITVKQDPRVKTPALAMQEVYTLTQAMYFGAVDAQEAVRQAQGLREQVAAVTPKATGATAEALMAFDKKVQAAIGATPAAGGGRGAGPGGGAGAAGGGRGGAPAVPPAGAPAASPTPTPSPTLTSAGAGLSGVMNSLMAADVPATANQRAAIAAARRTATAAMAQWASLKTVDLPALNLALKTAGLAPLKVQ
jgi:photosystem II stability/assembly factor-like uncharacterized protein